MTSLFRVDSHVGCNPKPLSLRTTQSSSFHYYCHVAMHRTSLIYLGRRGGGLEVVAGILLELNNLLSFQNMVVLNEDLWESEYLDEFAQTQQFNYLGGISMNSLIKNPFRVLNSLKTVASKIESEGIDTAVFLMPSPLDLILMRFLKEKKIKIIYSVHDSKAHRGELFPSKLFLKMAYRRSQTIVTFSIYVQKQIAKLGLNSLLLPLPYLKMSAHTDDDRDFEPYALFIGRMKKYKGLKLLNDAWGIYKNTLENSSQVDMKLRIVGSGKFPNNLESQNSVVIENSWLSHQKIRDEISKAKIVIFPYIEASQSGLIPIARELRVPVVVNNVGGLEEQFVHGRDGILVQTLTAEALAIAINEALNNTLTPVPNSASFEKGLKEIIGVKNFE